MLHRVMLMMLALCFVISDMLMLVTRIVLGVALM